MDYISTRNSSNSFKFEDVFIKGLADDGGLFIPKSLHKFSQKDLLEFKDLEYNELAKKIIHPFIGDFMNEHDLSKIIDKSYSVFRKKNVVDLVEIGNMFVFVNSDSQLKRYHSENPRIGMRRFRFYSGLSWGGGGRRPTGLYLPRAS